MISSNILIQAVFLMVPLLEQETFYEKIYKRQTRAIFKLCSKGS